MSKSQQFYIGLKFLLHKLIVQISKRFHTQHFGTLFFAYLFWNHFMVKRFCLWKTAGRGDSAKKLHLPCIEIFNIKTPKVVLFRQEASIPTTLLEPQMCPDKYFMIIPISEFFLGSIFKFLLHYFIWCKKMYFPLTTLYYPKSQKQ